MDRSITNYTSFPVAFQCVFSVRLAKWLVVPDNKSLQRIGLAQKAQPSAHGKTRKEQTMTLLILSDLHGSAADTALALEAFKREEADYLVLLGDVLARGNWQSPLAHQPSKRPACSTRWPKKPLLSREIVIWMAWSGWLFHLPLVFQQS